MPYHAANVISWSAAYAERGSVSRLRHVRRQRFAHAGQRHARLVTRVRFGNGADGNDVKDWRRQRERVSLHGFAGVRKK